MFPTEGDLLGDQIFRAVIDRNHRIDHLIRSFRPVKASSSYSLLGLRYTFFPIYNSINGSCKNISGTTSPRLPVPRYGSGQNIHCFPRHCNIW